MRTILFLILLVATTQAVATQQAPDVLLFEGKELRLTTSWAYPSPLETYYKQSGKTSPFRGVSTALYRGHIATWLIENEYLYLNNVEANGKDIQPSEIGSKLGKKQSSNGSLSADWFSGVLKATELEYTEAERIFSADYYFNVQHGRILESVRFTREDYDNYEQNRANKDVQSKKIAITELYQRYTDYYFRLNEQDEVIWNDKALKLKTTSGMSPLLQLYNNDHLNWPFNWNNKSKTGAPNCKWYIDKNNRLFIDEIKLLTGSDIYKAEKSEVLLSEVIPNSDNEEAHFANWVNGIFILEEGKMVEEYGYSSFKADFAHFVKIENGILKEHYKIDVTADIEQIESSSNQGLIRLFKEWKQKAGI